MQLIMITIIAGPLEVVGARQGRQEGARGRRGLINDELLATSC